MTITRPTQAALTPSLARTPDELTATNVVSGWIESAAALLVAPALAGVLLAVGRPGSVFASWPPPRSSRRCSSCARAGAAPAALRRDGGAVSEALGGIRRRAASTRSLRLLVGLLGAQFVAIGALDVLFVVLAIDMLGTGEGWVGYLNAAFGAGGVLGGPVTVALVGRAISRRRSRVGADLAAAFVVIALWP